jgi:AcrR family transcriptional regulator
VGVNRYHSPRRTDAAAATRAAILTAGRELFMRAGYATTTVPQIARQARVAVPTVYSSTGGKSEILFALLEPVVNDPSVAETLAAVASENDGAKIIVLLGDGVFTTHTRHWDVITGLFPQVRIEPGTAEVYRDVIAAYQSAVGRIADRLVEVGALRPDLGRDDALDILWFYLGLNAWAALVQDRGWTLQRARDWLVAAAQAALLPT